MKFNFYRLIILASLVQIWSNAASGHFYRLQKWSNGSNSIICLSDFHICDDPKNSVCDKQRQDLIKIAKSLNAFLILEDVLVGTMEATVTLFKNTLNFDPNKFICSSEDLKKIINSKSECPITGFKSLCHYNGIKYDNVEFRFAKRMSMQGFPIKARTYLDSVDKIKKDIDSYNDGDILNNYYKNTLLSYDKCVEKCMDLFQALKNSDKSIKDILPNITFKEIYRSALSDICDRDFKDYPQKKVIERLITEFDWKLLDLRILHSIYENSLNKNIIVCAGGSHINNISLMLELMGYKKLVSTGEEGKTFPNGKMLEPKAIDLEVEFQKLDLFK